MVKKQGDDLRMKTELVDSRFGTLGIELVNGSLMKSGKECFANIKNRDNWIKIINEVLNIGYEKCIDDVNLILKKLKEEDRNE